MNVGKDVFYTHINKKGQITIPIKFRKALNITSETLLLVTCDGVGVFFTPVSIVPRKKIKNLELI